MSQDRKDAIGGIFTADFVSVPAGDIDVPGMPAGAAGSNRIGETVLSSLAGLFTVSPDVARFLRPLPRTMNQVPHLDAHTPRPYDYAERLSELLTIGD